MMGRALETVATAIKSRWLTVLITAVLGYFAYHALHGERGLLAWMDKSRALEAARQELDRVTAERLELEREVRAFQEDQIDRDRLEEELRKLGYVKPNELIILRPDRPAPETRG